MYGILLQYFLQKSSLIDWLTVHAAVRANISGLFFTPRCPQDTGNYTVIAINDYGFETATAFVHVVCQYASMQFSICVI